MDDGTLAPAGNAENGVMVTAMTSIPRTGDIDHIGTTAFNIVRAFI